MSDKDLNNAFSEVEEGQSEANLGGHLYKKRVSFQGKGKS